MPMFMTRVELHSASDDNYKTLHAAMEQRGFFRIIQGDNGVWYQLPTAEYHCFSNLTKEQVRSHAALAADTTGKNYSVIVTESNGTAWIGLALVS